MSKNFKTGIWKVRVLAWDDLAIGDPGGENIERQRYEDLRVIIEDEGGQFEYVTDPNEFFESVRKSFYNFVVIDCFDNSDKVGVEYASRVNEIARQSDVYTGFDLPIVLLSKEIDRLTYAEIQGANATPLEKVEAPVIAARLKQLFLPVGRWTRSKKLFVIRRQNEESFTGLPLQESLMEQIREAAADEDFSVHEIKVGPATETLRQVVEGVLRSEKVIALLTRDELLEFEDMGKKKSGDKGKRVYVARPNIYLEVGMILLQPFLQKKSLVCLQEDVFFPSDLGGREPLRFKDKLKDSHLVQIAKFLRSPPY